MEKALLRVLDANPGKNYCAECLARAAGYTSPEDRTPASQMMRSKFRTYTDDVVEDAPCAGCSQTRMVVRQKP